MSKSKAFRRIPFFLHKRVSLLPSPHAGHNISVQHHPQPLLLLNERLRGSPLSKYYVSLCGRVRILIWNLIFTFRFNLKCQYLFLPSQIASWIVFLFCFQQPRFAIREHLRNWSDKNTRRWVVISVFPRTQERFVCCVLCSPQKRCIFNWSKIALELSIWFQQRVSR